MAPGQYVMRVTPSWEGTPPARPIEVKVSADPPGLCCPLMLILLMLCVPAYGSIRSGSFETSRWADSVVQDVDYTGRYAERERARARQHAAEEDYDDDDGGEDE